MYRNRGLFAALLCVAVVLLLTAGVAVAEKYAYPESKTGDVVDDYHGTNVADPYRWLEDPEADDTRAWVDKQNTLTRSYIDAFEGRSMIEERMTKLWNYPRYSVPRKHGDYYFFTKNDGLQNQTVFYTVGGDLAGEPKVVLDPNTWSEDGTVALAGMSFSDDGKYMAYAKADSGSDWSKWYIRDLHTGKDLADVLTWTKFTGTAWTNDSKGFFYSRFDEIAEEDKFQALNKNQKL